MAKKGRFGEPRSITYHDQNSPGVSYGIPALMFRRKQYVKLYRGNDIEDARKIFNKARRENPNGECQLLYAVKRRRRIGSSKVFYVIQKLAT